MKKLDNKKKIKTNSELYNFVEDSKNGNKSNYNQTNDVNRKKNKNSRMDLGKTISQCDLKQLLLLIFFIIGILCDIFILKLNLRLNLVIKWYYRLLIAVPIFLFSIQIAKKSMAIIYYEIRTPPVIVDKGPFRYSRHPMYLSALLLYFSFIVGCSSILGLGLYSIVVIFYSYLIQFEEKHLIRQYQEKYLEYKKKVSKWVDIHQIFTFFRPI